MLRNLETLKLASEAYKVKESKKPKYSGYDAYKSQTNGKEMHDYMPYRSEALIRQQAQEELDRMNEPRGKYHGEHSAATKYQNFVIPKKSSGYLPPITSSSSRNNLQRNYTTESDDMYSTKQSAHTVLKENYYSEQKRAKSKSRLEVNPLSSDQSENNTQFGQRIYNIINDIKQDPLVSKKLQDKKLAADIDIFDPKIVSKQKHANSSKNFGGLKRFDQDGRGGLYDPQGNELSTDNSAAGPNGKIPLKNGKNRPSSR